MFKGLSPKVGEKPALDDYMAAHPEWRVKEDRRQWPGMLIWERVVPLVAPVALIAPAAPVAAVTPTTLVTVPAAPIARITGGACPAAFKMIIDKRYDDYVHTRGYALTTPGDGKDIKDHMNAMYLLASDPAVHHVTELGVRNVVSSYAFAKAAMERPGQVVYRAHDLEERAANTAMTALMSQCPAVDYKFTAGDDLKVPIEDTDFMLIDTWHTYKQLAAELELLAPKVRKYLAFHDTVAFAHQ